jgi:hypothetical protein
VWDVQGAAAERVFVWYNKTSDTWEAYINGNYRITSAAQTFKAGDWVHLVLTCDFGADSYSLYVNGALAGNTTTALTAPTLTTWCVGSTYNRTEQSGYTIGEYATFGRVLTAEQIAAMHASGKALVDAGATAGPYLSILDGTFTFASSSTGARTQINVDGIKAYTTTAQTVWIKTTGDALFGSNVAAPATTALAVFATAQTYNSESLGAGDVLFGDNSANKANMLWDVSDGKLLFRGGTTTQAYINTTGEVMAGGGAVRINASGIQGYAGATQRFNLAADGSGWVGASDVLRWTTAGVVAFKAAGLVDPWEAPSLLDALYLPNAGGGGEQMFAWEGISGRLQTSYGSAVWLVQGGPYPTSFGCTNQGGPYRDFDGGTNAMLIFDSGVPEDQWQEPTSNTFLLWAWVNADVLATTNRTVLAKWEASRKYQYILYWDVTVGAFRFVISGNGTNATVVDSSIAESTGTWYFVAGFYNPSTLLRIYVAPATASALTINSNTTSIPASIKDSTSPLEFGQSAGGSFWDGKIGICAAWRGLPAASVDNYVALLFQKTKQFYGG